MLFRAGEVVLWEYIVEEMSLMRKVGNEFRVVMGKSEERPQLFRVCRRFGLSQDLNPIGV